LVLNKSKQKKTGRKKTSEQARIGSTASPRPQTHKLEPNNNKQQLKNQRTNEQATTNKPINNICISNDYQTASQTQKEPKTYDEHASRNNQTFLLANCKQNEIMASKLTLKR
jgi:hypothetical protein